MNLNIESMSLDTKSATWFRYIEIKLQIYVEKYHIFMTTWVTNEFKYVEMQLRINVNLERKLKQTTLEWTVKQVES